MAPRFCLTGWHPKAGALIAPRQYSLPKIARWVCACRAIILLLPKYINNNNQPTNTVLNK